MDTKETTFASALGRTILPREGIGAARQDERPTLQAYDLTAIPKRDRRPVQQKPVAAMPKKPVYEKSPKPSLLRRKKTQDPFMARLSRLS